MSFSVQELEFALEELDVVRNPEAYKDCKTPEQIAKLAALHSDRIKKDVEGIIAEMKQHVTTQILFERNH